MLYDRVIRNIQNRHQRIMRMNSFINARLQKKLRKFTENPISGSRVPPLRWVSGLRTHQKSLVSGPTFRICLMTLKLKAFQIWCKNIIHLIKM